LDTQQLLRAACADALRVEHAGFVNQGLIASKNAVVNAYAFGIVRDRVRARPGACWRRCGRQPRGFRYTNAFALLQPKVANPRKWSAETPDRTLEAANVQCAQRSSAFIPLFGCPRLPDVWELP